MNNEAEDELDYQDLIEKVALIDKDAAEYMQTEMRELTGFCSSADLWDVVVWEKTKQGTNYWYDIAGKIGQ